KRSDFIPIIKGIETPLVLVAHPSVPAKSFAEWVAYAEANRGKLTYANYGPGTISHFLGYQLNERFDLGLTQVPYRGNAPQMVDLLAGHGVLGLTEREAGGRAGGLGAAARVRIERGQALCAAARRAAARRARSSRSHRHGLVRAPAQDGHTRRRGQALRGGRDRRPCRS